jgi:2-(1,2-epoxy-1,2-dihydrophenyl)acetyl-CoA isomerase
VSTYPELLEQGRADERSLVDVERNEDRAVLTLSDPLRLNSLTTGLVLQLQDRLAELAADPLLRAVVITGEDPAFSAGGDLELIETGSKAIRKATEPADTTDAWRWIRRQFGGVVRTIASTDKAFIAAVNGPAAGVGLAFALACDIIIASERAVLVPAFGRLGLVPEVGTSWLLTRRLGYHEALALYVRGRHIEAFEMTKPLLRAAADASWEQSLALEEYAEGNCFSTATLAQAAAAIKASAD